MKNRSLGERIGFAMDGWRAAWRRERSFRTQAMVALLAFIALVILRPAPIWWAIVALTCALVLALELINSALEAVIDLLHPGLHPEIKAAKDMLAGAVLAISVAALIVGSALIVQRVRELLGGLT
ncbi:undecaprenol kinase [Sphingomonas sp. UYAg733]